MQFTGADWLEGFLLKKRRRDNMNKIVEGNKTVAACKMLYSAVVQFVERRICARRNGYCLLRMHEWSFNVQYVFQLVGVMITDENIGCSDILCTVRYSGLEKKFDGCVSVCMLPW